MRNMRYYTAVLIRTVLDSPECIGDSTHDCELLHLHRSWCLVIRFSVSCEWTQPDKSSSYDAVYQFCSRRIRMRSLASSRSHLNLRGFITIGLVPLRGIRFTRALRGISAVTAEKDNIVLIVFSPFLSFPSLREQYDRPVR